MGNMTGDGSVTNEFWGGGNGQVNIKAKSDDPPGSKIAVPSNYK